VCCGLRSRAACIRALPRAHQRRCCRHASLDCKWMVCSASVFSFVSPALIKPQPTACKPASKATCRISCPSSPDDLWHICWPVSLLRAH
jgi:hypothetical protein